MTIEKKALCDFCQITLKFPAEIVVPYTRKQEGQLLEKTAGTDIIAHGKYHSEENDFFFFFSFILLGWTNID